MDFIPDRGILFLRLFARHQFINFFRFRKANTIVKKYYIKHLFFFRGNVQ